MADLLEVSDLGTWFYTRQGIVKAVDGVDFSVAAGETLAIVESAYSGAPGKTVHRVKTLAPIQKGDTLIARVDSDSRHATMRNHTGTHLLHAALRQVLATGKVGEVYNIGGNSERTNIDVVQTLCGMLDALHPRADGKSSSLVFQICLPLCASTA